MHLRFNADSLIARAAAEASGSVTAGGPAPLERPWRRPPALPSPRSPTPFGRTWSTTGELAADDPRRRRLEVALQAGVIGDLDSAGRALTVDAACWSPSLSVGSLSEAEAALAERPAVLAVDEFRIEGLWWCDPVAIAEWHVAASVVGPLLVCDEVLVERSGGRVDVFGASFAALRDGRIAAMHTYFDEASVIEQVLFA